MENVLEHRNFHYVALLAYGLDDFLAFGPRYRYAVLTVEHLQLVAIGIAANVADGRNVHQVGAVAANYQRAADLGLDVFEVCAEQLPGDAIGGFPEYG